MADSKIRAEKNRATPNISFVHSSVNIIYQQKKTNGDNESGGEKRSLKYSLVYGYRVYNSVDLVFSLGSVVGDEEGAAGGAIEKFGKQQVFLTEQRFQVAADSADESVVAQ